MNEQAKEVSGKQEIKKEKKVTKLSSARKRYQQSEKRRVANKSAARTIKTAVKNLKDAVSAKGEKTTAAASLQTAYKLLDKATKTGIYKKNKSSRLKSKLAKMVSASCK